MNVFGYKIFNIPMTMEIDAERVNFHVMRNKILPKLQY